MENKEKIIKEILYEESTREMLLRKGNDVTATPRLIKFPIWKYIAAASIIGLLVFVGYQNLSNTEINRQQIVQANFEFPTISKSRGQQVNISDQYINLINQAKYSEVLPQLVGEELTEKDNFVKVNIFFAQNQYKEAQNLISDVKWQDEYHQDQTQWLSFLINVQLGKSTQNLKLLSEDLNPEFQSKAAVIIRSLE